MILYLQDPTTLVDMGVVEQNVRNAISLAATTFTITHLLMPGDLSTLAPEATGETTEPQRPDEIRVRASDAGWGIAQSDVALLNQVLSPQTSTWCFGWKRKFFYYYLENKTC